MRCAMVSPPCDTQSCIALFHPLACPVVRYFHPLVCTAVRGFHPLVSPLVSPLVQRPTRCSVRRYRACSSEKRGWGVAPHVEAV